MRTQRGSHSVAPSLWRHLKLEIIWSSSVRRPSNSSDSSGRAAELNRSDPGIAVHCRSVTGNPAPLVDSISANFGEQVFGYCFKIPSSSHAMPARLAPWLIFCLSQELVISHTRRNIPIAASTVSSSQTHTEPTRDSENGTRS